MGSHLDIDFSPIFFDFGGQNGAKLGGEIDKQSIQKGIKKQMRKSTPLESARGRPGGPDGVV